MLTLDPCNQPQGLGDGANSVLAALLLCALWCAYLFGREHGKVLGRSATTREVEHEQ